MYVLVICNASLPHLFIFPNQLIHYYNVHPFNRPPCPVPVSLLVFIITLLLRDNFSYKKRRIPGNCCFAYLCNQQRLFEQSQQRCCTQLFIYKHNEPLLEPSCKVIVHHQANVVCSTQKLAFELALDSSIELSFHYCILLLCLAF